MILRQLNRLLGRPTASLIDTYGVFEGYASVFGLVDLGLDVVMPGAFSHSLSRRSASEIRLLWQHDPQLPIGRWLTVFEDQYGLFVRGQLDLDLKQGSALHKCILGGSIDGLSIGYRTEASRREADTGRRLIDRLDLWEVSIVAFPLLPQARIGPRVLNDGGRVPA